MPALSSVELAPDERLQVVATNTIVADVVRQVGGNRIQVTTLVGPGTDPHAFEPTPRDAAALADADVVFANGAGLEIFLEDLLQSAGGDVPVVPVSHGLELHQLRDVVHGRDEEGAEDDAPANGESDPHTWFDPNNVIVWSHNIERALSALDPESDTAYSANAEAYRSQLVALDVWIERQVALVDESERKLVSDHDVLSYFAERYGFEQAGAVLPGFSTLSEPSARDLAALQSAIRAWDVKAIFVGQTANPDIAKRVADDAGVALVALYTGSLSGPDGPAADYLSLMRYDVTAIVQALR
jgi:ABC-type Zn uptake system ZnuABC Zn-binding protein ZnuA